MTDNDWTTGTYQDIVAKYNANAKKDFPPAHAVDILSIATQSDPIPMKDVSENFMDHLEGRYLGESPLARILRENKIRMKVDGKKEIKTSRWMMLNVDQEFGPRKYDDEMQHHMTHGEATFKVGTNSYIP